MYILLNMYYIYIYITKNVCYEPSVLRQSGYDGMSRDCWTSEVLEELSTRCPVTNSILAALLESSINLEKKHLAICLIYGFFRCHELSRIQRINSVLLIEGQSSVNVSHS